MVNQQHHLEWTSERARGVQLFWVFEVILMYLRITDVSQKWLVNNFTRLWKVSQGDPGEIVWASTGSQSGGSGRCLLLDFSLEGNHFTIWNPVKGWGITGENITDDYETDLLLFNLCCFKSSKYFEGELTPEMRQCYHPEKGQDPGVSPSDLANYGFKSDFVPRHSGNIRSGDQWKIELSQIDEWWFWMERLYHKDLNFWEKGNLTHTLTEALRKTQLHPPEGPWTNLRHQEQEALWSCRTETTSTESETKGDSREIYSRWRIKIKTQKVLLSEVEIGSLPEKEFRVMVVKII